MSNERTPRFGDVRKLHEERKQQGDETTTEQIEKPADQQISKATKRRVSKPKSQQASKPASKQMNKSTKQKASKSKARPPIDPNEETAGIGGRVPLSWRNHWVGEARKRGTTVIEVIIEAMTERFGLPKK